MNSFAVDETIKGVINQCHLHNYQLLLNYTGLELEAELAALETLSRSKVDGIVLMATNITEQHIQIIEKINVPVIIVGQEHAQLHSIYHDDYQAGFEIGMRIGQKDYTKSLYLALVNVMLLLVLNVKRTNRCSKTI